MRPASGPSILDALTPDDFVGAVMRTHDRIRSNLSALVRGAAVSLPAESPDDASIISVYCLHRGVETHRRGLRHADPRWLAV
jgi:hypothetical protein